MIGWIQGRFIYFTYKRPDGSGVRLGGSFKLFYHDVAGRRNEVGVVLKKQYVKSVLEVKRVSDRVMSMKLEAEGEMMNVVSEYTLQVEYEMDENEEF